MNVAWLAHDTLTLRRLIAPDFSGITSTGRRVDRAAMLQQAATNSETHTDVSEFTVRVFGDVAIAISRITDTGTRAGTAAFRVSTRVTDIFVHRSRAWQLVASQETELASPRPEPSKQLPNER